MSNPAGEDLSVPSTGTESLLVLGGSDDKKQAAGAAGSTAASQSQLNMPRVSNASSVAQESVPIEVPIPTVTLSLEQELELNALIKLLWEFHDWLDNFRVGDTLTAGQREELARRIEAADQVLTGYRRLFDKLPELRHGECEEKFSDVYGPVMIRANKLLESPTVKLASFVGPKRERSEVDKPPPPETTINTQLFVDDYETLKDYEAKPDQDPAALVESWKNVMSKMSDVRYVKETKNFRDRFFRLAKPPSLGNPSQRKFFKGFHKTFEVFRKRFVELLDLGDFAAPDESDDVPTSVSTDVLTYHV